MAEGCGCPLPEPFLPLAFIFLSSSLSFIPSCLSCSLKGTGTAASYYDKRNALAPSQELIGEREAGMNGFPLLPSPRPPGPWSIVPIWQICSEPWRNRGK